MGRGARFGGVPLQRQRFHQATAFFCREVIADVWPQFEQEIR